MRNLLVLADSFEDLDPFDAAFVEAVLRIQGIDEVPTREQLRAALQELNDYIGALSRAPRSDDPVDAEWLDGHTLDSAASQFAFLFMQYGVLRVSQASRDQMAAFNHWWQTGELPTRPSSLHDRNTAAVAH